MPLVYDVGIHRGDDTAYYLHRGHDVVGIDANPEMIEYCDRRFTREVAQGRLKLLNLGIAPTSGTRTFWICLDHDDWSSFKQSFAGRDGSRHREVEVRTASFDEVISDHGVPWYCKIDIEGYDHHCLHAMTRGMAPRYVSAELGERATFDHLVRLGYKRFKIVDQHRLWTVGAPHLLLSLPRPFPGIASRAASAFRSCQLEDWRFPEGWSSGPISSELPNGWMGERRVRALGGWLLSGRPRTGVDAWYDIHATR